MKIAIVYDSSTGTTANASQKMGKTLEAHGHQCRVQSISLADPADVSEADLICIGSWVKGLFNIRQHPTEGTMKFIERLGDLAGKNVVVFCTYKLAIGSTLRQMAEALEEEGAIVEEQFKFRWGIGLVMHAAYVFGIGRWLGPDWEEKKIKETMDQD